jgi:hypothetical protein
VIKKPTIIITSLGRTGTMFFYTLFRDVIPDCTALHEPDVFKIVRYRETDERIKQMLAQIREVGVYHLVIRKALGRWSLVRLSDARLRGELGHTETVQRVLSQRKRFVDSRSGSVYVESSFAYYGLIDILKDVFENHRVAYIVRDGGDWIRSWISWKEMQGKRWGMYGKGKIESLFGHNWPTASEMENDPYKRKWDSMSGFEKLCWAWFRLNKYALETVQENPNARLFRFEDIFQSEYRYQHLTDLVQFVTTFPNAEPISTGPLDGWLDRQIYKSVGRFPPKKEWSAKHKQQFRTICGTLMEDLGYELDQG